jgi:hypothetical protein
MKAKDWVILRLVYEITSNKAYVARTNSDVMRSILYLMRKYGAKHMSECMFKLNEEKESNDE